MHDREGEDVFVLLSALSSNAGTSLWFCWRLTLQEEHRIEIKAGRSIKNA
jgi:hypothetical protein